MTRGGSALNLRTSTIRPLFFLKREANKKKKPVGTSKKSFLLKRNNGVYVLDEILNGFE